MFKQNHADATQTSKPHHRLPPLSGAQGNDWSHQIEIDAAWPTESDNGYALSFKTMPMELLTGGCQLYIFPVEDCGQEQ